MSKSNILLKEELLTDDEREIDEHHPYIGSLVSADESGFSTPDSTIQYHLNRELARVRKDSFEMRYAENNVTVIALNIFYFLLKSRGVSRWLREKQSNLYIFVYHGFYSLLGTEEIYQYGMKLVQS